MCLNVVWYPASISSSNATRDPDDLGMCCHNTSELRVAPKSERKIVAFVGINHGVHQNVIEMASK